MDYDEDGMADMKLALETLTTQAKELGWKHRNLETKAEDQAAYARDEIAKDRHEVSQELRVTCGSMKRTIKAVTRNQKQLSMFAANLTIHFDRLAEWAANANRKLNAIHRDAIETETQLSAWRPDLEDLEIESKALLENIGDLLEEMQDASRQIVESREEAEKELSSRHMQELLYQNDHRHYQKKARWLWAGALVTGGLTAPFALAASGSKRKYRKKRNLNAVQAITVKESIKKCQEIESQLKEDLEEIRDANSDIEATKESLDEMTQKKGVLTTLVQTQLQQYCGLKEKAMMIASQTRSLQARVKTLTYAEGVQEVRNVMCGLVNDMQQMEMKALMNETGIKFQHISGLLTTKAAESMV
ncbi:MAG: hypothetical protein L6R42_001545 [Xanthoria sp. 1 TBL-2021]|nr:MAG: hypothetical protein L6R42_001545 [Xanthoria sp. 1 TBL-2021]